MRASAAAVAVLVALVTVAASANATRLDRGAAYLESRQRADGGFAEPGRSSDPSLSAWVVLGLASVGRPARQTGTYLTGEPYRSVTDLALRILALDALGRDVGALAGQLEGLREPSGRIGPLVNSTIWGVLALRAADRPAGKSTIRYLKRAQRSSGGWPWATGGNADSNDTAAAIQALRAAGVGKKQKAIRKGLAYLRRLQNGDGGFELASGRGSDAQSTAWAVQAFLAAGRQPGKPAFAYLRRLQRPDGSFRYSVRYATTPVWVTAQVLPALAREFFPLR